MIITEIQTPNQEFICHDHVWWHPNVYLVYQFIHRDSGMKYFGKTSINAMHERMNCHMSAEGSTPRFHDAIKKFGFDAFDVSIVATFNDEHDALEYEGEMIELHETWDESKGFNIHRPALFVSGCDIITEPDISDSEIVNFNDDSIDEEHMSDDALSVLKEIRKRKMERR